jgi:hypothetical protein
LLRRFLIITQQPKPPDAGFCRKISANEKAYIELEKRWALPIIQLILSCEGSLSVSKLAQAVKAAAEACPETRARKVKSLWVDTKVPPPVIEIPIKNCETNSSQLPVRMSMIFHKPMLVNSSHVAEVFLIRESGHHFSILFRIFHGVMDGQGALAFVDNTFRALREEPLTLARDTITDQDFILGQKASRHPISLTCNFSPIFQTGAPHKNEIFWKRITVKGKWFGLTARIASSVASFSKHNQVRILIPSNIRRISSKPPVCGNFTLPLYLDILKTDNWLNIYRKMYSEIQQNKDINLAATDFGFINWFPSWAIQLILRVLLVWQKRTNRFFSSATITNLGTLNLNRYCTNELSTQTLYSLPTHQPLVPLSIAVTEFSHHVEIVLSSYEKVVPHDFAERLLKKIKDDLKTEENNRKTHEGAR